MVSDLIVVRNSHNRNGTLNPDGTNKYRENSPIIFDVTHALQMPGGLSDAAGGRRQQVVELGKAGMSQGLAGLFLEAHPDPDQAMCDGPCALPLDKLEPFLGQMKAVDELVKSLPTIEVN